MISGKRSAKISGSKKVSWSFGQSASTTTKATAANVSA
jgi:hypothetical protein